MSEDDDRAGVDGPPSPPPDIGPVEQQLLAVILDGAAALLDDVADELAQLDPATNVPPAQLARHIHAIAEGLRSRRALEQQQEAPPA